ncbi:MAG: HNH endonuclease signature motif containing protein [Phycisphaeraceae bacterium]
MSSISGQLRAMVVQRAGDRCEYCGLSQIGQEATFHIDHIVPSSSADDDSPQNLALACVSCSLRKGSRQHLVDPQTQALVPIFNPRHDLWSDHFRWNGPYLVGVTPVGRAVVDGLSLNRPLIVAIRAEERERGRHPAE